MLINRFKLLGITLVTVLFFTVFYQTTLNAADDKPAKYVFLFIGDGMSLAQVNATEALLSETKIFDDFRHLKGKNKLVMNNIDFTGVASTSAKNRYITCSSAAGTALATGNKTSINTVSKTADREEDMKTIAEMAKEKGMKTGIITSVSIDHATPACFYAHADDRENYYSISGQMAKSNFDFFGGGFSKGNAAKHGPGNVVELMKQNGYIVTSTRDAMKDVKVGNKLWAYTEYTPNDAALYFEIDKQNNPMYSSGITLAEFTKKAIEMLDNKGGFFIMVEGGKIDWACHENDVLTMAYEVAALDEAIAEAIDFYIEHPKETLIIVTADHECGGLTIGSSYTKYDSEFKILKYQKISSDLFKEKIETWKTGQNVSFSMALDSVRYYFGLGDTVKSKKLALSDFEKAKLEEAYNYSMGKSSELTKEYTQVAYGGNNAFAVTVIKLLNNKAGFGWTSFSHTGINVPIYAIGQGADLFRGKLDNTDITKRIIKAAKLKKKK